MHNTYEAALEECVSIATRKKKKKQSKTKPEVDRNAVILNPSDDKPGKDKNFFWVTKMNCKLPCICQFINSFSGFSYYHNILKGKAPISSFTSKAHIQLVFVWVCKKAYKTQYVPVHLAAYHVPKHPTYACRLGISICKQCIPFHLPFFSAIEVELYHWFILRSVISASLCGE